LPAGVKPSAPRPPRPKTPSGMGFACGLRASSSGMRLKPLDGLLSLVSCTKMTISCEISPQLSEFYPNFATFVHKKCYQG
jgi:hypothetical protein